MKNNHVIIIGAGIGGLALGCRLAADGYRVKIFEKSERPGGWLKMTRYNGFTFQNGGNILAMPQLLEELFSRTGRDMTDYLTLKELDPIFQMRFPDERSFLYYRETADRSMKNSFFTLNDQAAHHKFLKRSEKALDSVGEVFTQKPLKLLNPFAAAFGFRWPRPGRTALNAAQRVFESSALQQVFSFWPLLCGGDPTECSHLFRILPAALQRWGAFIPQGGPEAVTNALVRLFQDCGGELLPRSEVQTIQTFNGRAIGVRLMDGSIHQSDYVVSDADAAHTCLNLIDSDRAIAFSVDQAKRKKKGLSVFIYHIGLRTPLKEKEPLSPFNAVIPENMEAWHTSLFEKHENPTEPFYFLSCPEKIDPSYVPDGSSALSVTVPVPNTDNQYPWELESYAYRSIVLKNLQRLFDDDLCSSLVCERFFTPRDITLWNNANSGCAWGFSPKQKSPNLPRMGNRFLGIRNFFLVGNNAHPGPFIPAVLKGAALTAEMIEKS